MIRQGDRFAVTVDAVVEKRNGKKLYLIEGLDILVDGDVMGTLQKLDDEKESEEESEEPESTIQVFRHKPVSVKRDEIEEGDQIAFTLSDGREYTATAIEKNDGYMLFIFDECVCRRPMNANGGTEGGYLKSDLRKYLTEEFYQMLPDWLTKMILPDINGDPLYLLSLTMVAGLDDDFNECDGQIPYFASEKNRVAEYQNETADWWLRDVVSASFFALVLNDGYCYIYHASNSFGVRPAFAISLS